MITTIEILSELVNEQMKRKVAYYRGNEALSVMEDYVKALSIFLEDVNTSYPNEPQTPEPEYKYMGAYSFKDKEYYCFKLVKEEELDVSDIIFNGSFITFIPDVWFSMGKPDFEALFVKAEKEGYELLKVGKEALAITGYCGHGNYIAYDICDKFKYIVEGYKSYKEEYALINTYTGEKFKGGEKYAVFIPSTEFRILTGIDINMTRIDYQLPNEKWEKRKYLIPVPAVVDAVERYDTQKEIFNKAVVVINESFRENRKYPEAYFRLEYRLKQLIRLLEMGAPKSLVLNSFNLVERSLKELNVRI